MTVAPRERDGQPAFDEIDALSRTVTTQQQKMVVDLGIGEDHQPWVLANTLQQSEFNRKTVKFEDPTSPVLASTMKQAPSEPLQGGAPSGHGQTFHEHHGRELAAAALEEVSEREDI